MSVARLGLASAVIQLAMNWAQRSVSPTRPGLEIVAAGFHPLDALPRDVTPATRSRLAEVLDGQPVSDGW